MTLLSARSPQAPPSPQKVIQRAQRPPKWVTFGVIFEHFFQLCEKAADMRSDRADSIGLRVGLPKITPFLVLFPIILCTFSCHWKNTTKKQHKIALLRTFCKQLPKSNPPGRGGSSKSLFRSFERPEPPGPPKPSKSAPESQKTSKMSKKGDKNTQKELKLGKHQLKQD